MSFQNVRSYFKRLPVLYKTASALKARYERARLNGQPPEKIFTEIFERNAWHGKASVSGTGSDSDQTINLQRVLPTIFEKLDIKTILDIPCGDYFWMKDVSLRDIDYLGADIVPSLIQSNSEKYSNGSVRFKTLDLIKDKLPKVDLVFCRDCLVHLSFEHIATALKNISSSNSDFLLTTTFPDVNKNRDIATGQWRTINLQQAPFSLPAPLELILEDCTEGDGEFAGKSLGLWKISDIRESINKHR